MADPLIEAIRDLIASTKLARFMRVYILPRPTRFKANDWVQVRYRTNIDSENIIGKVIRYDSARGQYLVAVMARLTNQRSNVTGVFSLSIKGAIWTMTREMQPADTKLVESLSTANTPKAAMQAIIGNPRHNNRRNTVRGLASAIDWVYTSMTSVPDRPDIIPSEIAYRPYERNEAFGRTRPT